LKRAPVINIDLETMELVSIQTTDLQEMDMPKSVEMDLTPYQGMTFTLRLQVDMPDDFSGSLIWIEPAIISSAYKAD